MWNVDPACGAVYLLSPDQNSPKHADRQHIVYPVQSQKLRIVNQRNHHHDPHPQGYPEQLSLLLGFICAADCHDSDNGDHEQQQNQLEVIIL